VDYDISQKSFAYDLFSVAQILTAMPKLQSHNAILLITKKRSKTKLLWHSFLSCVFEFQFQLFLEINFRSRSLLLTTGFFSG